MGLRFEVLGPLRVRGDDEIEVGRPSHRRLLSILLLEFGRRVPTDELIERFWDGTAPDQAKMAIQTHISALRRLLQADAIVTEGYGYSIPSAHHELDSAAFVAHAQDAHRHVRERDWPAAARSVDAALGHWRGPPFPDLRDDTFAQPTIARLEELHVGLREQRAEILLATGRSAEALPDLEQLVVEHPLRERGWEQLMLARYRLGRHADALAAYQRAREVLHELGLEPGARLQQLQGRILRHDETLAEDRRHDLPPELTRFIGRDDERRRVAELVDEHRMVTLTGVGGVGKTRLAVRVAGDLVDAFPDGCWFVPLAPLRDDHLVAREVVATMGLPPHGDGLGATLRSSVATATVLVVLDNCEHLREAAAAVAQELLQAGPDVTVVATSREPLGVPGESVYEVPPMRVPDTDGADLRSFDAVRLFEDRARLSHPDVRVEEEPAAVVDICRRLDGVPLAIELAAARMRSLSAGTIAERLDDRFRLLTGGGTTVPPRQRTLEATVRWSHDLLAPTEQALFARLSVFRGSFDVPMAERVGSGDGVEEADVIAVLVSLVEKSLVTTYDTPVGRRYRLLETLRDYAGRRLAERGEQDEVRRRHRDWCAAFAGDVVERALGAGRAEAVDRLAVDADNLHAALDGALAVDDRPAVTALAGALAWHWGERNHLEVASSLLRTALQACGAAPQREAELRSRLAWCRFGTGDVAAAGAESQRAYDLIVDAPPSRAKVSVLARHASLFRLLVDRDARDAVDVSRAALAVAEAVGDHVVEVRARAQLAQTLGWGGDIDDALRQQRAALDLAHATGDTTVILAGYDGLFDLLYLHPTERREGPPRLTERLLAWLDASDPARARDRAIEIDWVPYVRLQTGEWDDAERLIDRLGARHLEGFHRTWHLMMRATLRWMQGRTDLARSDLEELGRTTVNPRWYHDYYPLLADVAADEGRRDDARRYAETYLAVEVDPSEEAMKLAAMAPVVRAEVEAALVDDAGREEWTRRAEEMVVAMRGRLRTFPSRTGGAVQLEIPATHLALAEAELSRATCPSPARWREARDRADYVHTRLYAGARLAEALLGAGQVDEGAARLSATRERATAVGAGRIVRELDAIAARSASVQR